MPPPRPCSTSTKPSGLQSGRHMKPAPSAAPSAAARHGDAESEHRMTENPFFEAWTTPFGLPPFDRIRPEHFPPAFDRGMAEQSTEIAAITGAAAAPSFANTIEALERSGRRLDQVSRVFFNLDSSDTNEALEAIARDYAP